jgi:ferredoxin
VGLRVRVDRDACQSSGRCVAAAPGAFRLDADHLAEATPAADALPEAHQREIARACPAIAISLHDEAGHEIDLD